MRPKLEAASMTKGSPGLPVTIQKTTLLGKQYSSVLFTVGVNQKPEEASVDAAITKLYGGRIRLVANTVSRVLDGPRDVYRAILALNAQTTPYETASGEGWTNVNANMFADPDDNIWEVSGSDDNRVLRRIGNDDLNAVLQERRSRHMATAVSAVDVAPSYGRHAAVLFFDTASEEMLFGLSVSPDKVFVPSDDGKGGEVKSFDAASVYGGSSHDRDAPSFAGAPETAASKAAIIEYYRKLYGQNKDFYAKIKKLIEDCLVI